MTLTEDQREEIRRLRSEGYTQEWVAQATGHNPKTVRKYAPGCPGKVPVAPVREAFLKSRLTACDVARALGWWTPSGPDSSRVKRTLGLLPDTNGRRQRSYRTLADAELVRLVAEAIGTPPWEVGA